MVSVHALHEAAARLNSTELEEILAAGVDVNSTDKDGNTALHIVMNNEFQGHLNEDLVTGCVDVLLRYKANHRAPGHNNQTPLELAITNKLYSCIHLLLKAGADMVSSLATELPNVILERLDDGVTYYQDTEGTDIIQLDWRPVLGYSDKRYKDENSIKLPPESEFMYKTITAKIKNLVDKEAIINHPLVKAFIHLKLAEIPKRYKMIQVFEIVYLCLMALFIYTLYFLRCPLNGLDSKGTTNTDGTTSTSTDSSSTIDPQQFTDETTEDYMFPPEEESTGEKCDINIITVFQCYIVLLLTLVFFGRDGYLVYRVGRIHFLEWRDWVWRISLFVNLPVLWPALYPSDDYNLTYSYPFCSVRATSRVSSYFTLFGGTSIYYVIKKVAILFISIHSLIQLETFKIFAVYVETFVSMLITVCKLLLLFSPMYLGFYMGFNLMFDDLARVFSFITMSVDAGTDTFSAIGDASKENSYTFELISKVFAFTFIVVMSIGFMNYVLATSIDDVQGLKQEAKVTRVLRQVRNILQVDQRSRSFRLVKHDPKMETSYFYTYKPIEEKQKLSAEIMLEITLLLKAKRDAQVDEAGDEPDESGTSRA
ncbi:Transient receptor potential channel pyrexia [Folsomia candida]|uniref:Transient receptor potential channel pyrexia n=1 Tax=Folsomia candida TaxID=158441 RepID=A0A226DV74_FOLCA|nr:Transient receptor potential channel pyrexia [Folsomia candida]